MTVDECLELCKAGITREQDTFDKMGFPREKSIGGTIMRHVASIAARFPWKKGPWIALTDAQMRGLEQELGRPLLNAGDVLFGWIKVCLCDDENVDHLRGFDAGKIVFDAYDDEE
jgi:hypothetical protein